MATPITEIIPRGKKRLIKALTDAGYTTLEACAMSGTDELLKLKGVGIESVIALKEHCFQRKINWPGKNERMRELIPYFMKRYEIDLNEARVVATVFYWDNAHPSSLSRLMF